MNAKKRSNSKTILSAVRIAAIIISFSAVQIAEALSNKELGLPDHVTGIHIVITLSEER